MRTGSSTPRRWTHGKTGLTTAERDELAAAEGNVCSRRSARYKKGGGLLREAEPVRFRFIAVEKAVHRVRILCRCLQVSASGYYAWCRRPSAASREDRRLKVLVRTSFEASKQRYGSRIHEDLREQHARVSRNG